MPRRLKSLDRSRRTPVLARGSVARALPPPDEPLDDLPPWEGWVDDPQAAEASAVAPSPGADPTASQVPSARPSDRPIARPLPPPPAGHAPTGWDWFAQWPFPTQLFCFSLVIAAGMWWSDRAELAATTPDPAPAVKPAPRSPSRLRPETFDWLNRLRETQVVTDQLEAEFAEAQEFYREYALDEFLDFDPWSLGTDEVVTLTHFCDQGFFTVEREILVKILERKIIDQPEHGASETRGAVARLEAAARDREARLASLREAAELYRRGRATQVAIPGAMTPEEDQSLRAKLVDKLAGVRRERERLDARIAELNALLR
jgi:hypothetical protein